MNENLIQLTDWRDKGPFMDRPNNWVFAQLFSPSKVANIHEYRSGHGPRLFGIYWSKISLHLWHCIALEFHPNPSIQLILQLSPPSNLGQSLLLPIVNQCLWILPYSCPCFLRDFAYPATPASSLLLSPVAHCFIDLLQPEHFLPR